MTAQLVPFPAGGIRLPPGYFVEAQQAVAYAVNQYPALSRNGWDPTRHVGLDVTCVATGLAFREAHNSPNCVVGLKQVLSRVRGISK